MYLKNYFKNFFIFNLVPSFYLCGTPNLKPGFQSLIRSAGFSCLHDIFRRRLPANQTQRSYVSRHTSDPKAARESPLSKVFMLPSLSFRNILSFLLTLYILLITYLLLNLFLLYYDSFSSLSSHIFSSFLHRWL